jgi:hypothetical protein
MKDQADNNGESMNANLAKFQEVLSANPALKSRVEALRGENLVEAARQIAAISAEAGTPVSAEEVLAAAGAIPEEELAAGSGGVGPWDIPDHKEEWYERLFKEKVGDAIRSVIGNGPPVPGAR